MVRDDKTPRIFAALIALVAWTGLALQFDASWNQASSVVEAFWTLFGFFTVLTNLMVAAIFTSIAIGRPYCAHPRMLTGLTLSILFVGIVYWLLLEDGDTLVGHEVQATFLLHKAAPAIVTLYWLGCVRKGKVGHRDPLLWAIYPIAYLIYAMARAAAGDSYAYPFIDPTQQGWSGVTLNILAIAIGFLCAGYGLFWLDRRLAVRRSSLITVLPL
jgi:hypothetical protein